MNRLKLFNIMPNNAVCAEIGVWLGQTSKLILDKTAPKMLHLIDPWTWNLEAPAKVPRDNYIASTRVAKSQVDMDNIYKRVCSDFRKNQKVTIHRMKSEEAIILFEENKFDWIYIDGCHHYEYIKKDLELYYSKVKTGGFITGDDYNWGHKYRLPVQRAVQEFIKDKRFNVELTKVIGNSQFIIRKR